MHPRSKRIMTTGTKGLRGVRWGNADAPYLPFDVELLTSLEQQRSP